MGSDKQGMPHILSVELDNDAGFRALVDLSPDAVYVVVDGYHRFANARGIELLGGTCLADIQRQPALEFMHPSFRADAEARTESLVVEKAPVPYVEELVIRLDGTVVETEAAGTPISLDGKPAALLVVRDITSRKRAETALRSAEERLRAAFKQAPTPMLITDSFGIIVHTNPALGRVLGRPHRDFIGEPCFDIVASEHRPAVQANWARLTSGDTQTIDGEFRYRRADGEVGWVYACAAELESDHGCVVHLTDVTASHLARQRLVRRANRDSLTGLANRSVILDRLHQDGTDEPEPMAVLFLDLDGFKTVNDQYGHHVGDAVLTVIGKRLRDAVPATDTVGRLGGDEFAVVVRGAGADTRARALATSIEAAITAPIRIADVWLTVGVSIGIADAGSNLVPPTHLLASADAAMYRAKAAQPQPRLPELGNAATSDSCEACAIALVTRGTPV